MKRGGWLKRKTPLRKVGARKKRQQKRYKEDDWPLIVQAVADRDKRCRFRLSPNCALEVETAGHLVYPDKGLDDLTLFAGTCHACNEAEREVRLSPQRQVALDLNTRLLEENRRAA